MNNIPKVDFFFCGAQKAGTTYFHRLLEECSTVDMGKKKEIAYFGLHYEKGIDWYHRFYAHSPNNICGDCTPGYMIQSQIVAPRIREYNPNAKLIFSLRNPLKRSWSQYWHNRNKGLEPLSFSDALFEEPSRIEKPFNHRYSYVSKSQYAKLLQPFYENFDSSQIYIIFFEKFHKNPEKEWSLLKEFLGISDNLAPPLLSTKVKATGIPFSQPFQSWLFSNKGRFRTTQTRRVWNWLNKYNLKLGKPIPKMDESILHQVERYFEEDRKSLAKLLGLEKDPWQD